LGGSRGSGGRTMFAEKNPQASKEWCSNSIITKDASGCVLGKGKKKRGKIKGGMILRKEAIEGAGFSSRG